MTAAAWRTGKRNGCAGSSVAPISLVRDNASKRLPMSLRADKYRQNAAEARQRARQTWDPSIKTAFEEVARGWLQLAEQLQWMDSQEASIAQTEK